MAKESNKKKNMRIKFYDRKFKCEFCDKAEPHYHTLEQLMGQGIIPDGS